MNLLFQTHSSYFFIFILLFIFFYIDFINSLFIILSCKVKHYYKIWKSNCEACKSKLGSKFDAIKVLESWKFFLVNLIYTKLDTKVTSTLRYNINSNSNYY